MFKVLKSKFEQFIRLVFINFLTPKNNSIILIEYPKSGGTWLGQLVSEYFKIPFPRNKFPGFKRSLYHGHYLPSRRILKNKKIIFLVRDGRDVMVSLYHHQLIWNNKNKHNPNKVNYYRKTTGFQNVEDVKENMNSFINYSFSHAPSKLQNFTFYGNWYNYNKAWLNNMKDQKNIYLIKYEDLLFNTEETLKKMFYEFFEEKNIDEASLKKIVHTFSFENQTNRKKGDENSKSFLRKGVSGDWENYFGEQEKETFKIFSKNMLVTLEYEKDTNW